jgi:hypothetical protein
VRAVHEAKVIVEFEAILREGTGKAGRHADRTKNIQTGQVVLAVHGSFGDANIGPAERSLGLRTGPGADITEAQFVQPGAAKRVGVGQRENPEAGITGTRKPIDIPDGIKAITWQCDLLIVIGEKNRPEILLFSVVR